MLIQVWAATPIISTSRPVSPPSVIISGGGGCAAFAAFPPPPGPGASPFPSGGRDSEFACMRACRTSFPWPPFPHLGSHVCRDITSVRRTCAVTLCGSPTPIDCGPRKLAVGEPSSSSLAMLLYPAHSTGCSVAALRRPQPEFLFLPLWHRRVQRPCPLGLRVVPFPRRAPLRVLHPLVFFDPFLGAPRLPHNTSHTRISPLCPTTPSSG